MNLMISKVFEYLSVLVRMIQAIKRDIVFVYKLVIIKDFSRRNKHKNTVEMFRQNYRSSPKKVCLEFQDKKWTYEDLELYSNKVANLFSNKLKLKKDDCVAMFMENSLEFVGVWLGLAKIGVISAMINTNLKQKSLIHCITAAKAQLVIYSLSLEESIKSVESRLQNDMKYIMVDHDETDTESNSKLVLSTLLNQVSNQIEYTIESINGDDILMYIYTSGTTGLPKPAIIKHSRFFLPSPSIKRLIGLNSSDKIYLSLPLYHGNGMLIGIGSAVIAGIPVALSKKFSASNFWKDCIKSEATVFIYIGEICRFLVNQPQSSIDKNHKIRLAIGNGLRENVWPEFDKRFNVPCIEFYGSTEGNVVLFNTAHRIGYCGFLPFSYLLPSSLLPMSLIKIDSDMNPIRDEKTGFCIPCKVGEKGVIIGIVGKDPKTAFNGYVNNPKATNSKILTDVYKKGQIAFNTGDLMVCDAYGYVKFCDRLGDTYRWRGENTSTVEVENLINSAFNDIEVVVYGVEIPNEEGKCGMAAIKFNQNSNFHIDKLAAHLKENLAAFARPIFIRITDTIDYTGTFKVQKVKLAKEGYDLNLVKDKIYYFESKIQQYSILTSDKYDNIINGNFRA